MANLNKVMLIGRLTREVECRAFANGGRVAKFGFAVNNRVKKENQWVDEPVFLNIEAYNRGDSGSLADRCEKFLHKGTQCFIEGHLVLDSWTAQNGEKKSQIKIVLDRLELLDNRQSEDIRTNNGNKGFSRDEKEGLSLDNSITFGDSTEKTRLNDSDLPF